MAALAMQDVLVDESTDWLRELRDPATREAAAARLHALLLRAARFELGRRSVAPGDRDDLALQAADDALVAILAKLDTFRGASRFTTWAYKFALLEAAVKARRRAWQRREITIDDEAWGRIPTRGGDELGTQGPPARIAPRGGDELETQELLAAIAAAVPRCLTDHQRRVLTALALDGVPVDVLAERLAPTRGALYKTLHDARRRLRAELEKEGLLP